jgi:hypothetical protein
MTRIPSDASDPRAPRRELRRIQAEARFGDFADATKAGPRLPWAA